MSRSVLSSLKHQAQPSVLGFDKIRIANLLNGFKSFTVHLSILTVTIIVKIILAKKIGRKIYPCLYQI